MDYYGVAMSWDDRFEQFYSQYIIVFVVAVIFLPDIFGTIKSCQRHKRTETFSIPIRMMLNTNTTHILYT